MIQQQLADVRKGLEDARSNVSSLSSRVSDAQWTARPPSGGWSASECIAHLTLTTNAYLPLLDASIAKLSAGAPLPSRYRREFGAWALEWILEPPARGRSKTLAQFVPGSADPKAATVHAFNESQDALLAWITKAERVPLNQAMITSPFNARLKYNAYAALRVLAAHQRRHIWQAERALRGLP
jgi:hypothetical protein